MKKPENAELLGYLYRDDKGRLFLNGVEVVDAYDLRIPRAHPPMMEKNILPDLEAEVEFEESLRSEILSDELQKARDSSTGSILLKEALLGVIAYLQKEDRHVNDELVRLRDKVRANELLHDNFRDNILKAVNKVNDYAVEIMERVKTLEEKQAIHRDDSVESASAADDRARQAETRLKYIEEWLGTADARVITAGKKSSLTELVIFLFKKVEGLEKDLAETRGTVTELNEDLGAIPKGLELRSVGDHIKNLYREAHKLFQKAGYSEVEEESEEEPVKKTRTYGGDKTYHHTGHVDVETHNGDVVAVWYRCAKLPFRQSEVGSVRAKDVTQNPDELPKIVSIEFEDKA